MTTSYTNTNLVDCNRLNSAEHRQGSLLKNKWTSKVGSGIKLEPGDKVSVHSSFISELGCGNPDVIETTGKLIGKRTFNYTVYDETDPIDGPFENYQTENNNHLPNKVRQRYVNNVDKEIDIFDNSLNIVISYYKNTNGEQHIHLPRRFDKIKPAEPVTGNLGADEFWRANEFRKIDSYENGQVKVIPDFSSRVADDWMYYRTPLYGVSPNINGEPKLNQMTGIVLVVDPNDPGKDINSFTTLGPEDASSRTGDGKGIGYIRATDNSRYTIFVMKKSFWNIDSSDYDDDFPPDNDLPGYGLGDRDIALVEYIQYKELKSYKIKDGFNSPANIGEALTEELNNVKKTETKNFYMGEISEAKDPYYTEDVFYGGPGQYQPNMSLTIESDTYKLIDSANWYTLSSDNYNEYYADANANANQSTLYYSAYSMIGVKRPELFNEQRKLNPINFPDFDQYNETNWFKWDGIQIIKADKTLSQFYSTISNIPASPAYPLNKDLLIMTTIEWTKDNLDIIKSSFDAQQNYPELFDYRQNIKVKSDTSRYIHYDSISNSELPLGYDGYEQRDGGVTNFIGVPSQVLFVKCDEKRKNIFNDGNDWKQLCYGFGYRYYSTTQSKYCIAFSNEGIQLNDSSDIFTHSNISFGSGQATQRKIGFDWHFNAYGTDCILPYTGIGKTDCDNRGFNALFNYDQPHYSAKEPPAKQAGQPLPPYPIERCVAPGMVASSIYPYTPSWASGATLPGNIMDFTWSIRHIYCGSIDPLIKFDTTTSRFQISQLHTPELSGNDFMVGAKGIKSGWSGKLLPGTDNGATASVAVYKINKHIEPFLYTPDIAPYFTEMELGNSTLGQQLTTVQATNSIGGFGQPVKDEDFGFKDKGDSYTDKNFRYMNEPFLFNLANEKIKFWTIFDAESGIFIQDFGIDKSWVQDSLLGIMGYSYNQLNPLIKTGNTQTRLTKDTASNINPVTTNALITPLDTRVLNRNLYNGSLPNNPSVPYSTMTNIYPGEVPDEGQSKKGIAGSMNYNVNRCIINNEIKATATSASFTAENLPRKMSIPYYLVCSNLIGDKYYNGAEDGNTSAIMAVVNRENGFGDYYFGSETSNEFTITMPTTISEITTTILDPKMKPARLDEDSCIIYKIVKQMNNNLNIVGDLTQKQLNNLGL